MKTTVDLADGLFHEAKRLAAKRNTTLRALIEEGLRHVLAQPAPKQPIVWKDLSVPGGKLAPGIREGDWEQMRSLMYPDGLGMGEAFMRELEERKRKEGKK